MTAPLRAPAAASFEPLTERVRWGIVSTGQIADMFTENLQLLPDECEVAAVASRDQGRADAFAARHQIPVAYGRYQDLAADPDIDVVYIASPHSHHREHAELFLAAGKHVLIEKPMTTSAADSRAVFERAEREHRFCCEATWNRFNPLIRKAGDLLRSGELGELRHLSGTVTFSYQGSDEHRLVNPELAGGAVWDMGVYPVTMMVGLAGRPDGVNGLTVPGKTGVEYHAAATLTWTASHPSLIGQIYLSFDAAKSLGFTIIGSKARLEFDDFLGPTTMRMLAADGSDVQEFVTSLPGDGYTVEAQEVHRCLRQGLGETELVSWQSTLDVAWVTDEWLAN